MSGTKSSSAEGTVKLCCRLTCLAALTLIGGCEFAGNGQGLDAQGNPSSSQQTPSDQSSGAAPGTTFDSIQRTVFDSSCALSGCHSGAAAPLGLQLDSGVSYGLLVGVSSAEVPGMKRVAPGDPANSYLVRKLEGTAQVGARMPLGGTPLPQQTIDGVKQWIAGGAQRAAPRGPLAVAAVIPAREATLAMLPARLQVFFTQEINAATLDANSVQLQRSNGAEGSAILLRPGLRYDALTFTATIDLTGTAPVPGTYTLTLRGDGGTPILDLGGAALDGDTDGRAGGDFVATFRVEDVTARAAGR